MSVTFNLKFIGQDKTNTMSAFQGKEIEIVNPYVILDNDTYKGLSIFPTKKIAAEFCQKWNFQKSLIRKVESRFQSGWAVGLGRNLYVPDLGEGMLIAKALGCVIESVIDERKYVNQKDTTIF